MIRKETDIEGCLILEFDRYVDDRGWFEEVYRSGAHGVYQGPGTQVNISKSKANVFRGIHCSPYAKYVACISGVVFDVVVDLRPESPTFLKTVGVWLTPDNRKQIVVPARCGHGFFSAEDDTQILYVQTGMYSKDADLEFNWRSPEFAIELPEPLQGGYILSDKDRDAPMFSRERLR